MHITPIEDALLRAPMGQTEMLNDLLNAALHERSRAAGDMVDRGYAIFARTRKLRSRAGIGLYTEASLFLLAIGHKLSGGMVHDPKFSL